MDCSAEKKRILTLENLLRLSLSKTGDRAWHSKVYEALGEPFPSPRILTGELPRYQLEQIRQGKLKI